MKSLRLVTGEGTLTSHMPRIARSDAAACAAQPPACAAAPALCLLPTPRLFRPQPVLSSPLFSFSLAAIQTPYLRTHTPLPPRPFFHPQPWSSSCSAPVSWSPPRSHQDALPSQRQVRPGGVRCHGGGPDRGVCLQCLIARHEGWVGPCTARLTPVVEGQIEVTYPSQQQGGWSGVGGGGQNEVHVWVCLVKARVGVCVGLHPTAGRLGVSDYHRRHWRGPAGALPLNPTLPYHPRPSCHRTALSRSSLAAPRARAS